jgi:hypothetical protein
MLGRGSDLDLVHSIISLSGPGPGPVVPPSLRGLHPVIRDTTPNTE